MATPGGIDAMWSFKGINTGTYKWNITDPQLIHKIMNAENGKVFRSNPFMMAKLKWILEVYPNGNRVSTKGSVRISLNLVSMPSDLEKIGISFSIKCVQTITSMTAMTEYTKTRKSWGYTSGILSLSDLQRLNLSELSISVTIKMNWIVLNKNSKYLRLINITSPNNPNDFNDKNKSQFIYKINDQTMKIIEKSKNRRIFESPLYDNMWLLQFHPNGYKPEHKGYFSVYLTLCTLPTFIKNITVKYNVKCIETSSSFGRITTLKFGNSNSGKSKVMKFKEIQSLTNLTFIIDIEILKVETRETNKDKNSVYEPNEIKKVLSMAFDQRLSADNHGGRKKTEVMDAKGDKLQQKYYSELEAMRQENKKSTERIVMLEANMKEMQHTLNKMMKEMRDLRLITMEEQKNEDLEDMRKQMRTLKGSMEDVMSTVGSWGNKQGNEEREEVRKWFTFTVRLPQYIPSFLQNGFESLEIIQEVEMTDLMAIGVELRGHRIKIMKEIRLLHQQTLPFGSPPPAQAQCEGNTSYLQ